MSTVAIQVLKTLSWTPHGRSRMTMAVLMPSLWRSAGGHPQPSYDGSVWPDSGRALEWYTWYLTDWYNEFSLVELSNHLLSFELISLLSINCAHPERIWKKWSKSQQYREQSSSELEGVAMVSWITWTIAVTAHHSPVWLPWLPCWLFTIFCKPRKILLYPSFMLSLTHRFTFWPLSPTIDISYLGGDDPSFTIHWSMVNHQSVVGINIAHHHIAISNPYLQLWTSIAVPLSEPASYHHSTTSILPPL